MFLWSVFVICRVESTILNVAAESETAVSQPVSKVKQKARAVLQEMVANVSPLFIRFQDHSVLKKQKKKTGLWLLLYFILSGWQGGCSSGCSMASFGASRSTKDSWRWWRKLPQRLASFRKAKRLNFHNWLSDVYIYSSSSLGFRGS